MRHHRQHAAGAGLTRRPRRADERGAGADQVVDDERGRARDLADEKVARYDAGAAVLFGKTLPDRFAARFFQRLPEKLRTLGSAGVRRDDRKRPILEQLGSIRMPSFLRRRSPSFIARTARARPSSSPTICRRSAPSGSRRSVPTRRSNGRLASAPRAMKASPTMSDRPKARSAMSNMPTSSRTS